MRICPPRSRWTIPGLLAALCVAALFVPALARAQCSLPVNETGPKTSDCLFILQAAVDLRGCALCICDVNGNGSVTAGDALICLNAAVGIEVDLDCPPCADTTTTTLGEISECPAFVEWTTRSGVGDACTTNAQCDIGVCDAASGRCRTASEVDLGWTGRAHDIDLDDGATLRLAIDCEADGTDCGECTIAGVDASAGNCRCGNDIRRVCDEAFEASNGSCPACNGGAFAGDPCVTGGDCVGGACEMHCAFDPEIVCATNADCPTGRKKCDATRRCGSGEGSMCNIDADCIGTCTGAATCLCYDSPPIPVASVEFPFCILPRLAEDVTGTIEVDSGAGEITKTIELLAYNGESLFSPCPVCGGTCNANHQTKCSADEDCAPGDSCGLDPVARDGVRGGICIGGEFNGQSCDLQATNPSFPARPGEPGGGGYSLDCSPSADASFTDSGLRILLVETTGTASLESVEPCNPSIPSAGNCPCLVCSGSSNVPCHTDTDCTGVRSCSLWSQVPCGTNADCQNLDVGTCTTFNDTRCSGNFERTCSSNAECASADFGTCEPGTCSSSGSGAFPSPNDCANEDCTAGPDGEGECTTGPTDRFCDGLRKADGGGIVLCLSNADCTSISLGFNAGTCTLSEKRDCFPDPIVATGDADPNEPRTAATFCLAPTAGSGQNTSIGAPGPARIERQATVEYFCASNPEVKYQPGIGGCP